MILQVEVYHVRLVQLIAEGVLAVSQMHVWLAIKVALYKLIKPANVQVS